MMPPTPTQFLRVLVCCGCVIASVLAKTHAQSVAEAQPTASISGRLTIDEGDNRQGVAGLPVILRPAEWTPRAKVVARTITDVDGRYTLANVPAGRYGVLPIAPAYVAPDLGAPYAAGKRINVVAGEAIEGVDFTLTRGGVITGRVTDAAGQPLIYQQVTATVVDSGAGNPPPHYVQSGYDLTDDRGVYRIYGLPAGNYRVGMGEDPSHPRIVRSGGSFYTRTFHPNATEEAQAKIIAVTTGGEATNVDISLGARAKAYKVAGRVIEAETRMPVTNAHVWFYLLEGDSQRSTGGARTNERGEFEVEVMPGRYWLHPMTDSQSDFNSGTHTVEVTDANVSGLELKMQRGVSLSGHLTLEGNADRATLARLSQLRIYAHRLRQDKMDIRPSAQEGRINHADHSFRIGGLRPGKVLLMVDSGWGNPKGFALARVERGGVEVREGIEITAGEHVTGVRVVLVYGESKVRGEIRIENGTLPEGTQMAVRARPLSGGAQAGFFAEVDARGRFLLEGLAAGDYELSLDSFPPRPRGAEVKQNVTVNGTGETTVTLVLDLSAKPPGN